MNVVLRSGQTAILRSVFPKTLPYHALSLLRAVVFGARGPFTAREVLLASNRIRRAGYTPDSLLAMLDLRKVDLT